MRREAHESYGVTLELRVDAQRDWTRCASRCEPIARARGDLSAVAARATPEMASAGLASPTTPAGKRISRWLQGRFRTPTAHSGECATSPCLQSKPPGQGEPGRWLKNTN